MTTATDKSSILYLDNAASAPLLPEIITKIQQHLNAPLNTLGNPSSTHTLGKSQASIISQQKTTLKKATRAEHVTFTSGGTEANNMALMGTCGVKSHFPATKKTKHIICGPVEHDSIYKPVRHTFHLQHGFEIDYMRIDPKTGNIDLDHFKTLCKEETVMVTQMWVSNLFGKVYDVEAIAKIMKRHAPNASLHIDAVQALGKIPIDLTPFKKMGVRTTCAVSGHKVHALKGIGALLFSDHSTFERMNALITGGGQESSKRSGTENVLGALSFGLAVEKACLQSLEYHQAHYRDLYDIVVNRLRTESAVVPLVDAGPQTFSIVALLVPGAPGEVYFNHLLQENICISTGSACQAKSKKIPRAYSARGLSQASVRHVLRVSFSSITTAEEVNRFCDALIELSKKFAPKAAIGGKTVEDFFQKTETDDAPSTNATSPSTSPSTVALQDFSKYSCILVRWGELALKGRNIKPFSFQLCKNIRAACKPICPGITVKELNRRIFIDLRHEEDHVKIPEMIERLKSVFGIWSISPVLKVNRDLAVLEQVVRHFAQRKLDEFSSRKDPIPFAVRLKIQKCAKRTEENLSTAQYEAHLGGIVIATNPDLWKVQLKKPEVEIGIEIRTDGVYTYSDVVYGAGGLPTGIHGKTLSLLSGGFDSPVASWMMMKRGCAVHYVSFWSHPYVGEKLVEKIERLVKQLSLYNSGKPKLHLVHFTKIQEAIRDHEGADRYRNILYRRAMNHIAMYLCNRSKCHSLTTGEALGQVASQTIKNITCIADSSKKLIFRPLIGMDKHEIIKIADEIGTGNISAEDAPDCCTLFQPDKPVTHGDLEECRKIEEGIPNYWDMMYEAYKSSQILRIDEHTDLDSIKLLREE